MAECRRCGADISQADVQKGRALQRGEFWYCPTCVADARAAKSGSAVAPATARASSSSARPAAASGSQKAPGALKAPPPSSTKMKPVPAPASRKVAAPPVQEELLDDEPAAEEEPAPTPGRTSGRGPSSSRMRPVPGPASSKIRKAAPPPEEDPAQSGSLRKKIGFKDGSAGVAPMSKQALMMWGLGGLAVFLIAGSIFFTLIIKRSRDHAELKDRTTQSTEAKAEFERIFREKPRDFEGIDRALQKFHEVAKNLPKFKADLEDADKAVARRKSDDKLKKASMEELSGITSLLGTVEGTDEALKKARKAIKNVKSVDWVQDEKKNYEDRMLSVLKAAAAAGETAKAVAPPDAVLIAGDYVVALELSHALPPEVFPAGDATKLQKDAEDAIEKRYSDPKYLEKFAWEDYTGESWNHDEWVTVAQGADGITLVNTKAETGLYWLNKQVNWADFMIRIEFTTDKAGFQVLQRQQGETPAAATHDVTALLEHDVIKEKEKVTLSLLIYGGKFITYLGAVAGRPARCAPTGSKAGGFSFRLPKDEKLVIHKVEVKVFVSDEEDSKPEKK